MSMSWVSNAFFLLFHFLMVCSLKINRDQCDSISSFFENNVTKNLYGIEVGLKRLASEDQLPYEVEGFDQIPLILNKFLSYQYQEAEPSLKSFIQSLYLCLETSRTGSGFIPKSTIEFSKSALNQAIEAHSSLLQLIDCKDNNKVDRDQQIYKSSFLENESNNCIVDGTKCQFSPCAHGNRLPICSIGFAAGAIGGGMGPYHMVTSSDDNPINPAPGTLRFAVNFASENKGGAWIIFKESMVVKLKAKLWIKSHTTIDGRGVNVTLIGYGLALAGVENVILHNFEVLSTGQSDTIHVFAGSHHIWIDHLSSQDANLGLITVLQGSTDVTISNCYLSNPNFNMLLGAADADTMDKILRVTVYRNWFDSSAQRMPHCRWGYCHVVNNYYKDWKYYAIGGRAHAKVLSELNVFDPGRKLEVTPWYEHFTADETPTIVSSEDLLLNGATFHQFLKFGTLGSPQSEFPAYKLPTQPTSSLVPLVTHCSGVMMGHKLKLCMATL